MHHELRGVNGTEPHRLRREVKVLRRVQKGADVAALPLIVAKTCMNLLTPTKPAVLSVGCIQ